MSRRGFVAVARLDFAEVSRSRWLAFALGVYVLLASVFVMVGLKESTVLGYTGTSRVLLSFCHTLVLVLPLLGLSATGLVVNQARATGTLELVLAQPVSRLDYFSAVAAVRFGFLTLPLVIVIGIVALVGQLAFGQAVPWGMLGRAVVISSALLAAFVGLGLLITTTVANQAKAVMVVLLVWLTSAALLDFALVGLMLEWRLPPRLVFALAALNPVEAARLALLSAVDRELSVLGPVGFYLANRLGNSALFAVGVIWPVLVGAASWSFAARWFQKGDVV
jgi:ABC-2 type transport system permease protein